MIECANPDCSKMFTKKTHNNIYCSQECCRIETNKKIIARYHKNKIIRGEIRICEIDGCSNELSQYNKKKVCAACDKSHRKTKMMAVKELFDAY